MRHRSVFTSVSACTRTGAAPTELAMEDVVAGLPAGHRTMFVARRARTWPCIACWLHSPSTAAADRRDRRRQRGRARTPAGGRADLAGPVARRPGARSTQLTGHATELADPAIRHGSTRSRFRSRAGIGLERRSARDGRVRAELVQSALRTLQIRVEEVCHRLHGGRSPTARRMRCASLPSASGRTSAPGHRGTAARSGRTEPTGSSVPWTINRGNRCSLEIGVTRRPVRPAAQPVANRQRRRRLRRPDCRAYFTSSANRERDRRAERRAEHPDVVAVRLPPATAGVDRR